MAKLYTFQFGPADNLSGRKLEVYKLNADGSRTELHNTSHAGSTTDVDVEIEDNLMCEAILTDTRKNITFAPVVAKFSTHAPRDTNFPSGDKSLEGMLWISSYEDLSSSSSSSSVSSSSSSSVSSSSSESSSSQSSSESSSSSSST